jgi:hypothetical protein
VRDGEAIPRGGGDGPCSSVMDQPLSPAEELPALYRAILDGIAALERQGDRREAALVRTEATRVYSTSWDESGRRRLAALQRRVERVVAGLERPREADRGWAPMGRSVLAR